jgi:hypothetical protein
MTRVEDGEGPDRRGQCPKTRTWWHPLLARVVHYLSGDTYEVQQEMVVGQLPLRIDLGLLWTNQRDLPDAMKRAMAVLADRMTPYNLIEFKAPTDSLTDGDMSAFLGCACLFFSQQREPIDHEDVSLFILAPAVTAGCRKELARLGLGLAQDEPGVYRVNNPLFRTWLVDLTVVGQHHPLLALFSPMILKDPEPIIRALIESGYGHLVYYVLQQIQQFQCEGEQFAMQHTAVEHLDEVSEALKASVIAAIPAEDRLRGLSAEERLRGLPPEERLRGLPPEERLRGLPPEERLRGLPPERIVDYLTAEGRLGQLDKNQLARLRDLLEQQQHE